MPAYLLAYHGGATPEGDEAQAAVMTAWNEWMESFADELIDGGNPVAATKTLEADGSISDAPANHITGYSIVEADDMESAIDLARGCPVLADGGTVEVSELVDMGMEPDDAEE